MNFVSRKTSPAGLCNRIVGKCIAKIRLNEVKQDGSEVIKRRNKFGSHISSVANWFFRFCRAPISFWPNLRGWQKWEVNCFQMLNPQFKARAVGTDKVCEDRLPGDSLWDHARRGTLNVYMIRAAAQEIRRAHGIWSDLYKGPWSHGDAAVRNFLYERSTGRVRLIDFELIHDPTLPAATRHTDDIMAFILDLCALAPSRRWPGFAVAFLRTYGDPVVCAEVRRRLYVPSGPAWFWWKIRTGFTAQRKIERRLVQLARAIDKGALSSAPRRNGTFTPTP